MEQETLEIIKKCVEKALEKNVPELHFEMSLSDDLEMESLQIVMLQVELEDAFGISFDPMEDDFFQIFSTVGGVYTAVKRKQG
ncbi:MAG: acyl carrier protein [Oscillospiraceae bacterium]|nr:acyl carrier protein [Oscillospiraceae bacterium]